MSLRRCCGLAYRQLLWLRCASSRATEGRDDKPAVKKSAPRDPVDAAIGAQARQLYVDPQLFSSASLR